MTETIDQPTMNTTETNVAQSPPQTLDLRRIWTSSQLPTLPTVAVKLLELSKSNDTEVEEFVELIKTDPALTAKLLKSANSTFCGLSSKVTSVESAFPLLGTTVVNSLALSFSLTEAAMSVGPMSEHYTAYWQQSIVQAAATETLSSYTPGADGGEYFLAGLLMDLGRLAMLKTVPKDYLRVIKAAKIEERSLSEVELEMLGVEHAEVGAQLLKNWHLPDSLANVTRHQNATVDELRAFRGTPDFPLICAVATAASLGDYFCSANKGLALQRIRVLTGEFFDLSDEALKELLDKVKTRTTDTANLFAVSLDELGDPADLMAQANEQLAQLMMREHAAKTQVAALHRKTELEKEELASQNEQLQKQALRDPLTRLYNRRFFDEILAKEVMFCARYTMPLGLIFADIDNFKKINDSHGHPFGDTVLQRVAAAFEEVGRNSDTLARYGGEEFVILVNRPSEMGLQKLSERLRARIESEQIQDDSGRVPVTVSIGAAMIIPARTDQDAGTKLVAAADEAMYRSKQLGRNQVQLSVMLNEQERRLLQAVMQRRFSRWLVQNRILDIPTVTKVMVDANGEPLRIGQLSARYGLIDKSQIETVLREMEHNDFHFGETAVNLGLFTEEQLGSLLAIQQEDPQRLAAAMKHLQILEPAQVDELLKRYLEDVLYQHQHSPVAVS